MVTTTMHSMREVYSHKVEHQTFRKGLCLLVSFTLQLAAPPSPCSPNHRAFRVSTKLSIRSFTYIHEPVDEREPRDCAGEEGDRHADQRPAVNDHPFHHEAEPLTAVLHEKTRRPGHQNSNNKNIVGRRRTRFLRELSSQVMTSFASGPRRCRAWLISSMRMSQ